MDDTTVFGGSPRAGGARRGAWAVAAGRHLGRGQVVYQPANFRARCPGTRDRRRRCLRSQRYPPSRFPSSPYWTCCACDAACAGTRSAKRLSATGVRKRSQHLECRDLSPLRTPQLLIPNALPSPSKRGKFGFSKNRHMGVSARSPAPSCAWSAACR
jgi:hypothetical protein